MYLVLALLEVVSVNFTLNEYNYDDDDMMVFGRPLAIVIG